jgi:hypothetical protein
LTRRRDHNREEPLGVKVLVHERERLGTGRLRAGLRDAEGGTDPVPGDEPRAADEDQDKQYEGDEPAHE